MLSRRALVAAGVIFLLIVVAGMPPGGPGFAASGDCSVLAPAPAHTGEMWTQQQIQDLWIGQGGNPDAALIASAIAMAETGGHPPWTSPNPAGGVNLGLWQIWDGNQGATLDPAGNAKAAIRLSRNGGWWGLWETFVNGDYLKFMGADTGSSSPAPACNTGGPGLDSLIAEADRMIALNQPYVWGGGHAAFSPNGPWDCSGAISQLLHHLGMLDGRPLTSGELEHWGKPGRGADFTVYANGGHVFLIVERGTHVGDAWGTATRDLEGKPGSGPMWHRHGTAGFVARHFDAAS